MAFRDIGTGQMHFGAERLQMQDFFGGHFLRHHQHHAVALDPRHQRQPKAGVAGGRFNHHAPRLQAPVRLRRFDHRQPDPVLDRTARILRFQLQEQLARSGVDTRDFNQRRVADQREQGRLRWV